MRERAPCVYILASDRTGTLYIGVTSNLPGRIHQHRCGITKGFVARYGVLTLVHLEMCDDMPSAIAREKQLKRWHREWKLNLIEQDNPDWHDLAVSVLGFPPLGHGTPPGGS